VSDINLLRHLWHHLPHAQASMSLKYEPTSEPLHISGPSCSGTTCLMQHAMVNHHLSRDATPCKVTPVILHGVVSPDRSDFTKLW